MAADDGNTEKKKTMVGCSFVSSGKCLFVVSNILIAWFFSEVNLSTCPNMLARLGVVGGGDVAGRAVRFFLSDQHVTRV